jgi:hypothetical protein
MARLLQKRKSCRNATFALSALMLFLWEVGKMSRKLFTLLGALLAGLILAAGPNQVKAAPIVGFAVDNGENLWSVNLTTHTATLIGNTGQFLEGLAISPGGQLFGTNTAGQLFSLNSTTAQATLIGSTGLGNVEGLKFSGNTLLGTNFSNPTTIYSINTSTAAATPLVTTNPAEGVVRTLALQGNTGFMASDTPVFQSLIATSLSTGATSVIGTLTGDDGNLMAAFDFGGGTLFGLDSAGNEVTINTATGQETVLGNLGGQFFLDLAIPPTAATAVPEPSALALFGLTGVGLLAWRRWKKS